MCIQCLRSFFFLFACLRRTGRLVKYGNSRGWGRDEGVTPGNYVGEFRDDQHKCLLPFAFNAVFIIIVVLRFFGWNYEGL